MVEANSRWRIWTDGSPLTRKGGRVDKVRWVEDKVRDRLLEATRHAPSEDDFLDVIFQGRQGNFPRGSMQHRAYEMITEFPRFKVYEDEDLLVMDKPPHMLSHNHQNIAFKLGVEEIARYLKGPEVIHANRLDYNTSGLLVFGKNFGSAVNLVDQFSNKAKSGVTKVYVTLLEGRFKNTGEKKVDAIIGNLSGRRVEILSENEDADHEMEGKHSTTFFNPLSVYETHGAQPTPLTLTRVQIVTGRTHQIRVVAADCLGMPVVGDTVYNRESGVEAPRQMLHAFRLGLQHPRTGMPMTFEAPIPPDFNDVLRDLTLIKNCAAGKNV